MPMENQQDRAFREIVRYVIGLEEDVWLAPPHKEGTEWLNDRIESRRCAYRHLLLQWPILPGRGTEREPPFS